MTPAFAGVQKVGEVKGSYAGKRKGNEPRFVSNKKVILTPGAMQRVKTKNAQLEIEYERIHPKGKFPEIRIQGIPFKMSKRGEKLEFTWNKAAYELQWLPKGNEVQLVSSKAFAEGGKLTTKSKEAKHALIKKGLIVKTKRKDGKMSKLEVTDVQKSKGRMTKFSTRTYADEASPNYQQENNIMSPQTFKQYEKGVNGEILYVFTSNRQGQVFVYYR